MEYIVILLYLLPCVIAMLRSHHNSASIAILNIFAGWTVIGWFLALIWCVSYTKK